jgi:hypothetical protein
MNAAAGLDPMSWLEKTQLGFDQVSKKERDAIRDFSLLWSLYEGTVLGASASARAIIADVDSLNTNGRLSLDLVRAPIEHFLSRYFDGKELTYAFSMLYLRPNDHAALVNRVVRRHSQDEAEVLSAILIIVLRLRNNLFHGLKWAYGIRDQFKNFRSANHILMAVMDMHR